MLAFLRSLLSWLGSFVYYDRILQLRECIPRNAYFLKKIYGTKSCTRSYVLCPRCSALYDWRNCIIKKHNGLVESAKCTNVLYPNNPHVSHRDKCKATLMKKVKCGSSYKLRPRKVSVYKSIKSSLERFLLVNLNFMKNVKLGERDVFHPR